MGQPRGQSKAHRTPERLGYVCAERMGATSSNEVIPQSVRASHQNISKVSHGSKQCSFKQSLKL